MNGTSEKQAVKEKLSHFSKISFAKKAIIKGSAIREKEFEKHKFNSFKLSVFISLFAWLGIGLVVKNLLLAAAISLALMAIVFVLLLQIPLAKQKALSKKVEADMPFFLTRMASEIRVGKGFFRALEDCAKEEDYASKEFRIVVDDINKGASIHEALKNMNERLNSLTVKRANSNLANIYSSGANGAYGLKRLAKEILSRQKIEIKEFSSKMVVYALVFIAISAIVPAMFLSFILIGSYFMKLSFTPTQILLISAGLFPILDGAVLMMINSKTPVFLRQL
ncbi:MAG: type II secretion system F family protein [archaeon]